MFHVNLIITHVDLYKLHYSIIMMNVDKFACWEGGGAEGGKSIQQYHLQMDKN